MTTTKPKTQLRLQAEARRRFWNAIAPIGVACSLLIGAAILLILRSAGL